MVIDWCKVWHIQRCREKSKRKNKQHQPNGHYNTSILLLFASHFQSFVCDANTIFIWNFFFFILFCNFEREKKTMKNEDEKTKKIVGTFSLLWFCSPLLEICNLHAWGVWKVLRKMVIFTQSPFNACFKWQRSQ